ncbi:MAG: transglutaminase domain-containing protein [Lentimicrobiaceae bacterium]|jgi:hypothetical protein|nr:transglutaminase domain-containing protein [Lentimicrobiaceae bacterium]
MKISFLRILFVLTLSILIMSACDHKHFIDDESYRKEVQQDFAARKNLAANRSLQLFDVFDQKITTEEREALEFLYAYMPYSDLADYDGAYFLDQVRYAFKARDYFSWGKTIPEDIFRHFVLVYRVNNENLDTARRVIFNEIKDRVKDLSMYDAALEVNHWCHEKVTYRPSDGRTSSSLATIKTAFGRCGEESTFTVTAMRAVGIPARQCYTPRWAHTDDNHAWVEVWVDGKWYFMGACEPDAALNMGWFATPSTRAMMVHSNAYGKYIGTEEINHRTDLFSRINMLYNYTNTKSITIIVKDEKGNLLNDATVKFKLYNYAEYYPIATRKTDEKGEASLTTGFGDLLIWASKDGNYAYSKIDVRQQDTLELTLNHRAGAEYVELFEIVPPVALPNKVTVDKEKEAENNRRLQYEDSIRNAYISTFPTEIYTQQIKNENLTPKRIWHFILKSEGNYAEIEKFLNQNAKPVDGFYLDKFLAALSDKDLRDTQADVLQQHITVYKEGIYPLDVYLKGIMPARISNELIRPWRAFLNAAFSAIFETKPTVNQLIEWTNANIKIDSEGNYFNCPLSPRGVFELRHSDRHSCNIFFVAVCRSLAIPAYLDNATNQLFVYENDTWQMIAFDAEKQPEPTGTLVLEYNGKEAITPEYWIHYTIAKFENGDFVTFDYENDSRVANFPATLALEQGYYLLSTGNRYHDGTTLSRVEFFNVKAGESVKKTIELRELIPRDESYGFIDLNHEIEVEEKKMLVSDLAKNNELILCFIDPTREPTKHLFKDITAHKAQFDEWSGNFLFVIPSDKYTVDFDVRRWNLPKNSLFIVDQNASWMHRILTVTNQEFRENYPLVFIVNQQGKLVFKTEGYRIGTGELLFKSL